MDEEKQRIAEAMFPQERMPYSRLKKEFLQAAYDIEIKEPLDWIIRKTIDSIPIALELKIPNTFPFQPPQVIVLSPKPFIFKAKNAWGPIKTIDSLFQPVAEILQTYRRPEATSPPPQVQAVIDLIKRTEKPVHLVLGSRPGENPVGRTIYSNPQIFLLDKMSGEGDTRRFFKIDFTKLEEMNWLCSQLPGAFETIILDTSTMKFFTPFPRDPHDHLKFLDILSCLYRLLSDTGIFFLADYNMGYGGLLPENTDIRPSAIMEDMVKSVGFQTEEKHVEELAHPLVKMVHKDRTDQEGAKYFLVATKPRRGGKRKSTRRKLKRRKLSKRR